MVFPLHPFCVTISLIRGKGAEKNDWADVTAPFPCRHRFRAAGPPQPNRENIEDRKRQSLNGVLPLSFFAFWPNFSPAAWSFRRRKEQPYFVLKKISRRLRCPFAVFLLQKRNNPPRFFLFIGGPRTNYRKKFWNSAKIRVLRKSITVAITQQKLSAKMQQNSIIKPASPLISTKGEELS